MLGGHGGSLLLRLAARSLQVLIADLARERARALSFDPEPLARPSHQPGRLEQLITGATPPDPAAPTELSAQLQDVAAALRALAKVPVPDLERMLRATVDASSHRIDPWLVAVPQRRLDALQAAGTLRRRLGAYGWVDAPAPGQPGPTPAGLLHTPSASSALAAAVLRDRAVSDPSPRWHLDITSRSARAASRIAAEVRNGAHLSEAMGREVERIVGHTQDIEALRQRFPVRTEHAGRRVCDGMKVLAAQSLPVTLDATQTAAIAELRAALDTYGDLLVADAVHHLVEGRADIAGQVMDAAAGLSRPPELSLLRTARDGRGISSSVVLALPHVPAAALPAAASERAFVSPAATLDPSAAAALTAQAGAAADWDFAIGPADHPVTVTLADLGLTPADALSLTRTSLQRLAAEFTGSAEGEVTGGSGGDRYERAAELAGLIGRNPATRRALSEARAADPPGDPVDPELIARYTAARDIGVALAGLLRAQVALLGGDGLGTADEPALRRLLAACAAWGIAPDAPGPAGPGRLAATARLALPQLDNRTRRRTRPGQRRAAVPRRVPRRGRGAGQPHRPARDHRRNTGAGHPAGAARPRARRRLADRRRGGTPGAGPTGSTPAHRGAAVHGVGEPGRRPVADQRAGRPAARRHLRRPGPGPRRRGHPRRGRGPGPVRRGDPRRGPAHRRRVRFRRPGGAGAAGHPARRPAIDGHAARPGHPGADPGRDPRARARPDGPPRRPGQPVLGTRADLPAARGRHHRHPAGGTRMIFDILLRLEPDPHQRDLARGWAAELADPAWLLGRQWQMGEHQGEDASSPVAVEIRSRATPIGAVAGQARPRPGDRARPGDHRIRAARLVDTRAAGSGSAASLRQRQRHSRTASPCPSRSR